MIHPDAERILREMNGIQLEPFDAQAHRELEEQERKELEEATIREIAMGLSTQWIKIDDYPVDIVHKVDKAVEHATLMYNTLNNIPQGEFVKHVDFKTSPVKRTNSIYVDKDYEITIKYEGSIETLEAKRERLELNEIILEIDDNTTFKIYWDLTDTPKIMKNNVVLEKHDLSIELAAYLIFTGTVEFRHIRYK